MHETSPAVKLRSQVVARVILAIIGLAFLLYGACILLVLLNRPVPGEMWLAAGNASGALIALLINSKNDSGAPPVQQVVGVPGGEPVPVVPEEPTFEEHPDNDEKITLVKPRKSG